MIIFTIIMSATMLLLGLYLSKSAPKDVSRYWGYRSKRSMSSQEAWEFGQKAAGNVYIILSFVNLVIFLGVYFLIKDMKNYKDILVICLNLEIVVLILGIPFAESKLKKFLNSSK